MVSSYETHVKLVLDSLKLSYQMQYKIPDVKKRRYDFILYYNGRSFLIEIDGEQHFSSNTHFRTTSKEQHLNDCMKQLLAVYYGYYVIRIHHKDVNNFQYHLVQALSKCSKIYYSNDSQYQWIEPTYYNTVSTLKGTIKRNLLKRYIKKKAMLEVPHNLSIFDILS